MLMLPLTLNRRLGLGSITSIISIYLDTVRFGFEFQGAGAGAARKKREEERREAGRDRDGEDEERREARRRRRRRTRMGIRRGSTGSMHCICIYVCAYQFEYLGRYLTGGL